MCLKESGEDVKGHLFYPCLIVHCVVINKAFFCPGVCWLTNDRGGSYFPVCSDTQLISEPKPSSSTHSSDGNGYLTAAAHTGDILAFVFGCATFFFLMQIQMQTAAVRARRKHKLWMKSVLDICYNVKEMPPPPTQGVQDHMTSPEPRVSGPRASKFIKFVSTNRKHTKTSQRRHQDFYRSTGADDPPVPVHHDWSQSN